MTSTHKTISLLVIVCALIMSSLFAYRIQQNNHSKAYASEHATRFPVGRDIKPFKLITSKQQPFTQKDFRNHWTLLFFGFTHCASVCPTTLDMLAHAYDQLIALEPNLQVVFISLDPTRDSTQKLDEYTKHFHPRFIGVTGKISEIRKLQAELHIYSEKDANTANNEYQIQHTSSILLINPQGEWAGLFSFGMKPEQFANEFKMATNLKA